MTDYSIQVKNVSKKFRLYHEKRTTIYETIVGSFNRKQYYEHLQVLDNISFEVKKGESFGAIGSAEVNGNWPPHLHYQFIADMMDMNGDFKGVATEAEADFYLSLCPEPVVL